MIHTFDKQKNHFQKGLEEKMMHTFDRQKISYEDEVQECTKTINKN